VSEVDWSNEKILPYGGNKITFPLLDEMIEIDIGGLDLHTKDFEYTHGESFCLARLENYN
jgi:hypothetical protein